MAKARTKIPTKIGVPGTAKVDPRREYLAGGILTGQSRALSNRIDDVMREVGPMAYDLMLHDPIVAKCISVLKISVLSDGVEFIPAVPEKDPDFPLAAEICEFCTLTVRGLEKPLKDTLEQMMDALAFGYKIAEITYKTGILKGFDGERLLLDRIKVKARDTVHFVVDNKLNVLGFVGRLARDFDHPVETLRPILQATAAGPIINGMPILPKEKFMVLTIRSQNEDPRGQSMLRPAYNAWQLKNQVWPEYLRYLLVCAIPLLVGTTGDPKNDIVQDFQRDSSGNPIQDTVGHFVQINPVEALRDALVQARNATTVALKFGSNVKEIGGQGAGTPFYKAIETFDQQIESAILNQTLATGQSKYQSRSAAQTHMSILDVLVYQLKGVIIDMLTSDLLRPLISFNYGDNALELMPKVSLGDTERRHFATDAAAVAALYSAGYLQPDQLPETDAMLGFQPRNSIDPQHLVQQLQDAGVPITAIPPDPTHVATIQAGPTGGQSPIPLISSVNVPTGARADSRQQTVSAERTKRARFPALGRLKNKLNSTPKNTGG